MMRKKNPQSLLSKSLFLSLFPAQCLASGLPAINTLLTTFILGRAFGPDALAAIGFLAPLTMLIGALSELLAAGSQLVCGRSLGSGDKKGLLQGFNSSLLLCVCVAIPVSLLLLFFPEQAAAILGAKGESLVPTSEYIHSYALGILFSVLSSCLLPFLYIDNAKKLANIGVSAMVAVNLLLNVLNVFWLDLGLYGAGLSLSVSNLVLTLFALPHFLFKSTAFRLRPRSCSLRSCLEILRSGLPSGVAPVLLSFWTRISNGYLFELGGAAAVSAMTIANNLSSSLGSFSGGNQRAARIVSSFYVGERNGEGVRQMPKIVAQSTGWVNILVYALLFIFTKPLVLLFGADPAQLPLYVMATRVFDFWFVTNIIKAPLLSTLEALGDTVLLTVINAMNSFGTPLLTCLLLAEPIGLTAVYSVSWVAELVTFLIVTIHYCIKCQRLPDSIFTLSYIPPELSVDPKRLFSATVRTEQEAIEASEQVRRFCLEHEKSGRISYYCSLCVEEICVNIARYGIGRSRRKDCAADVRVICQEDSISILIKDNCASFDPNSWLELCSSDDPLRGIGIRTVSRLSSSMQYAASLGLNVLTIELT